MHASTINFGQLPLWQRSLIETELNNGEKITWIGAPIPWRFGIKELPKTLFAILWTALTINEMSGDSGIEIPDLAEGFHIWLGIFFVLVSGFIVLFFTCLPVWEMFKARRTAYVLTTARTIIFEGGISKAIRSYGPNHLIDLRCKERSAGAGDLIFERIKKREGEYRQTIDIGFLAISNVKQVEDLIYQMINMNTDRAANHETGSRQGRGDILDDAREGIYLPLVQNVTGP